MLTERYILYIDLLFTFQNHISINPQINKITQNIIWGQLRSKWRITAGIELAVAVLFP